MRFYLGSHRPAWLSTAGVPLFVSHATLGKIRGKLPRAAAPWALDSGGYTQLNQHGRWTITPEEYADAVRRYSSEIGRPDFAAAQDWMCEPHVLAKTGLSVAEHQRRSLENYLRLRELAPEVPWAPVIQGWTPGQYLDHVDAYQRAGVPLAHLPAVGVGTVCRRQDTTRIGFLLRELKDAGLDNLHGFGFKTDGLRRLEQSAVGGQAFPLASADSLAWSTAARMSAFDRSRALVTGCTHGGKACNNCLDYALAWRRELLERIPSAREAARSVPPRATPRALPGPSGDIGGATGEQRTMFNPAADDGRYRYVTSCVGSTYEDIRAMLDGGHEREIARSTFVRKLAPGEWRAIQAQLGYGRDFSITRWRRPREFPLSFWDRDGTLLGANSVEHAESIPSNVVLGTNDLAHNVGLANPQGV